VFKVYFLKPGNYLKMGACFLWGPQRYTAAPGRVTFDTDCFSQSTHK